MTVSQTAIGRTQHQKTHTNTDVVVCTNEAFVKAGYVCQRLHQNICSNPEIVIKDREYFLRVWTQRNIAWKY